MPNYQQFSCSLNKLVPGQSLGGLGAPVTTGRDLKSRVLPVHWVGMFFWGGELTPEFISSPKPRQLSVIRKQKRRPSEESKVSKKPGRMWTER